MAKRDCLIGINSIKVWDTSLIVIGGTSEQ